MTGGGHFEPAPSLTKATFTRKRFRPNTQTFLYGSTFRLHENGENAHKNVFTSKTLSKVETFENATKEMQCKCRVNAENVNAETVIYQAWSTTKVGVDSEKPRRKEACALRVVTLF